MSSNDSIVSLQQLRRMQFLNQASLMLVFIVDVTKTVAMFILAASNSVKT